MKNKEIEQAEKDLHKIEEEPSPELRFEPMKEGLRNMVHIMVPHPVILNLKKWLNGYVIHLK